MIQQPKNMIWARVKDLSKHFPKEVKYIQGKQIQDKVRIVTNHQRNAIQNYNKLPSHTC